MSSGATDPGRPDGPMARSGLGRDRHGELGVAGDLTRRPTIRSRTGRYIRCEFQTTHSSPPGRSTRAASANSRSATPECTVAPTWNGGLSTTRSVQPSARLDAAAARITVTRSATSLAAAVANDVADRVTVIRDDAASSLAEGCTDLVVLNPPFHVGATVHSGVALRLFADAARVLRPSGELWTVWNSHLLYRPVLERFVGPTRQIARNAKVTAWSRPS